MELHVPQGQKCYAFVTFESAKVAQALIGKEHEIAGHVVFIKSVTPKSDGPTAKRRMAEMNFAMAGGCLLYTSPSPRD